MCEANSATIHPTSFQYILMKECQPVGGARGKVS